MVSVHVSVCAFLHYYIKSLSTFYGLAGNINDKKIKYYINSLNIHTTLINNNKINDKEKLNMYAKLKIIKCKCHNMLLLKKIITRELKLCNIIYKKIKGNKILQENRCKSKTKVQLMKKVVKKLRKNRPERPTYHGSQLLV